jgi:hypothetical protein
MCVCARASEYVRRQCCHTRSDLLYGEREKCTLDQVSLDTRMAGAEEEEQGEEEEQRREEEEDV